MPVQGNFINVVGRDEIFALIDNLDEFATYGTIGAVFSSGAVNEYGDRYEFYVQSREEQAWMHKGRWQTEEDVAEEKEPDVADILESVAQMIIDGASGAQLRPMVRQALELIRRRLREDPPKPGTSRYERTGRLRNSWEIELLI